MCSICSKTDSWNLNIGPALKRRFLSCRRNPIVIFEVPTILEIQRNLLNVGKKSPSLPLAAKTTGPCFLWYRLITLPWFVIWNGRLWPGYSAFHMPGTGKFGILERALVMVNMPCRLMKGVPFLFILDTSWGSWGLDLNFKSSCLVGCYRWHALALFGHFASITRMYETLLHRFVRSQMPLAIPKHTSPSKMDWLYALFPFFSPGSVGCISAMLPRTMIWHSWFEARKTHGDGLAARG